MSDTDPAPAGSPQERMELAGEGAEALSILVGGVEFGLPVEWVRTVIRLPPITRLPFPPPAVLGVASVQGVIVPVVDLGERLLGRPSPRDGRLVMVVDPKTGQSYGLLVEQVRTLVAGGASRPEAPGEVEVSLPPGWVAGLLAPSADRIITLLDLEPVLAVGASTDKEQ